MWVFNQLSSVKFFGMFLFQTQLIQKVHVFHVCFTTFLLSLLQLTNKGCVTRVSTIFFRTTLTHRYLCTQAFLRQGPIHSTMLQLQGHYCQTRNVPIPTSFTSQYCRRNQKGTNSNTVHWKLVNSPSLSHCENKGQKLNEIQWQLNITVFTVFNITAIKVNE